jgi:hypothetical protein
MSVLVNLKQISQTWIDLFGSRIYKHVLTIPTKATRPVTVAERSKTCTVFARSEAEIVGSNSTQNMDVWCLC